MFPLEQEKQLSLPCGASPKLASMKSGFAASHSF
jgi:hypothetical protein